MLQQRRRLTDAKRRRDADVLEAALVVQPEEQRARQRPVAAPAEPADDAVDGAALLHLEPRALPGRVRAVAALRDHALERLDPFRRQLSRRRDAPDGDGRALEQTLEAPSPFAQRRREKRQLAFG